MPQNILKNNRSPKAESAVPNNSKLYKCKKCKEEFWGTSPYRTIWCRCGSYKEVVEIPFDLEAK
jgi:DNA-directed RNA polymerase subunit RPC12/RpoP